MVLVDKETGRTYGTEESHSHKDNNYAKKGLAGTALGFGIGGVALSLLNGGFGIFGGNKPNNTEAVGKLNASEWIKSIDESVVNLYAKQAEDRFNTNEELWKQAYIAQGSRYEDRIANMNAAAEIYASMNNAEQRNNKNIFDLYEYTRKSDDATRAELCAMKSELAVLKATRPYQDALIQCEIENVAKTADYNLWRRTCHMLTGQTVIPNTTVTGFGSYNGCGCSSSSDTGTATT